MEKPLKLLVRSWQQGKGCVHQRSVAMSEAEARELLEIGRGAIDKAQESGGIEQIPLAKGRAYVKARRAPDPDEPSRMAPGFVLVSIPDPDAFIREVVAREFEELLRSAANATLDQISSPGEGDLDKRGWKILDLGRPQAILKGKSQSSVLGRQKRGLLALIVVIVAVYWWYPRSWQSSRNQQGQTQSRADKTADGSDPAESNWKEVREQIKEVLAADWAQRLIDHETPSYGTNRDLLRRFAGLFQRPDLKNVLSEKNFKCYELEEPSGHPFIAFLNRLPENTPPLQDGRSDLTPTEAIVYLKRLDEELKRSKPSCIKLDLDKPERLADEVKINLNYLDFFRAWFSDLPSDSPSRGYWGKNDPLDKSRAEQGLYLWVKTIRDLIETRYSGR